MTKTVLDVGNCGPDFSTMKHYLTGKFDVTVEQAHGTKDTLERLRRGGIDLVLINRKLDMDYSDGSVILKQIKADSDLAHTPVMLISNYAEHQEAAIELGAIRGFGKLEYDKAETYDRLDAVLG